MRLLVFDVDGTITEKKKQISQEMANLFCRISEQYTIIITSGANIHNINSQLAPVLPHIHKIYSNYCSECIPQIDLKYNSSILKFIKNREFSIDAHKISVNSSKDIEVRQGIAKKIKRAFPTTECYVSGRRSIDILPAGVSKHLFLHNINEPFIYFGDEFYEFGNDATILNNPLATIYSVSSPKQTYSILETLCEKN